MRTRAVNPNGREAGTNHVQRRRFGAEYPFLDANKRASVIKSRRRKGAHIPFSFHSIFSARNAPEFFGECRTVYEQELATKRWREKKEYKKISREAGCTGWGCEGDGNDGKLLTVPTAGTDTTFLWAETKRNFQIISLISACVAFPNGFVITFLI